MYIGRPLAKPWITLELICRDDERESKFGLVRAGRKEIQKSGISNIRDGEVTQLLQWGVMPGDIKRLKKFEGNDMDTGLGGKVGSNPVNESNQGSSSGASRPEGKLVNKEVR